MLRHLGAVSDSVQPESLPTAPSNAMPLALKAALLVRAEAVEAFQLVAGEIERAYRPLGLVVELECQSAGAAKCRFEARRVS